MARRKKSKKQEEETLIDVVGRVNSAQDYIEENSSKVLGIIGLIVVIAAAIVAYLYLYKAPKAKEAQEMMYHAQYEFSRDSFAYALDKPTTGGKGFLDIIDDYSGTQSANLASYYAGISYLNLGNYKTAIDYLNDYSAKDRVTSSMKFAALGDAYSEIGDDAKALSNYEKATTTDPNEYYTPMHLLKLGQYQESKGNKEAAKAAYQKITDNYPKSSFVNEAEKYLLRASN